MIWRCALSGRLPFTGTGTVSISGTPVGAYSVQVKIATSGEFVIV